MFQPIFYRHLVYRPSHMPCSVCVYVMGYSYSLYLVFDVIQMNGVVNDRLTGDREDFPFLLVIGPTI